MSKEARKWLLCAIPLVWVCTGASHRTRNFIVTAATPRMASEIGEAAERQRLELAQLWLGRALPDWREPCPVRVESGDGIPPSGQTSFSFRGSDVTGWNMLVRGSWERILDSVLPHEITHTIFATHFQQPLPRWADEGACTTVEHREEKAKHQMWLVRYLQEDRGIAFANMFAMTDYPRDMLPLYAQGFSLARFLIEQRGRATFIQFLESGLATRNWRDAVRENYDYASLGALQNAWLEWVRQGSPVLTEEQENPTRLASATQRLQQAVASAEPGYRGQSPEGVVPASAELTLEPLPNKSRLPKATQMLTSQAGQLAEVRSNSESAPGLLLPLEKPDGAGQGGASDSTPNMAMSSAGNDSGSYYLAIAQGKLPVQDAGASASAPAPAIVAANASAPPRKILLEWSRESSPSAPIMLSSHSSDVRIR